tara:strand:+ start:41 stop:232 length:192 start_codon:yes stop_codon:yes gene_type:complete
MNKLWISLAGIIFTTTILSLLAKFFDVQEIYYIPFMIWIIALFLFNIFLEQEHKNVFMKEIRN